MANQNNDPVKISLEISPELWERLNEHAKMEAIPVLEFILEATERYMDQNEFLDANELIDILENENLLD